MASKKGAKNKTQGTIYLLCYSRKFRHARHYIGFCEQPLEDRLEEHFSGQGANFTRALKNAGIEANCVRTWEGTRELERQLKNRRDARSLCPNCKEGRNYEKAFSAMMSRIKRIWREAREAKAQAAPAV